MNLNKMSQGNVLIFVILLMLIFISVGTTLLLSARMQGRTSANLLYSQEAFYSAHAGIEEARGRIVDIKRWKHWDTHMWDVLAIKTANDYSWTRQVDFENDGIVDLDYTVTVRDSIKDDILETEGVSLEQGAPQWYRTFVDATSEGRGPVNARSRIEATIMSLRKE